MTDFLADAAERALECELPATSEGVERFIAALHGFLAEEGLGRLAFDMELLAREALMNAVQHGSGTDPGMTVAVRLSRGPGALTLCVRDQGPGFDWRHAAADSPEPMAEKGRGLFIIGKYSDGFAFNEPGNALTMTKRLPSEELEMTNTASDHVRLAMGPRVTAQNVPALRESFRASIQQGARRLALDFSHVESLDSMGIGLLVATHNSLAKLGGALELTGVGKDIHQLLILMRLDKHFHITAQEGEGS